MLLCLCSKNNEADVLEVFERRPEMPLRLDHVLAHRINWRPKSESLASLAARSSLGLRAASCSSDDSPIRVRVEVQRRAARRSRSSSSPGMRPSFPRAIRRN